MNTKNKIISIIEDLSGSDNVNSTDNLQSDLGLDSLMMVTLLVELEDKLKIELDEADMNPFDLVVVQDVIDLAQTYLGDENEENS